MNIMISTYIIYLIISLGLTAWVANTLHKNGHYFLVESFNGNEALANSVNHLLVVGFYLINLGYIAFALTEARNIESSQNLIEVLSLKIGRVLMVLGILHFMNIFIFSSINKSKKQRINNSEHNLSQRKVDVSNLK